MKNMIRISDKNYKQLAELAKEIGKSETETLELTVLEFYKDLGKKNVKFLKKRLSQADEDASTRVQDF